jgi:hypothetical protein
MKTRAAICLALFVLAAHEVRADQVEMQNGDRYVGKVVSMTGASVVLQSDLLGKMILPRSKITSISVGATASAQAAPSLASQTKTVSLSLTNGGADMTAALRQLAANTNLVEQVRKQFLANAGPDANNKYDDLMAGLMSGKLDMNSLRAQAKAAVDQIKSLKGQGGDAGESLDGYLAILDSFLNESAPAAPTVAPRTNAASGINIVR